MIPVTRNILIAAGTLTAVAGTALLIRWRIRKRSENVDNEAYALVEAQKEAAETGISIPKTQAEKLASLHPRVREKVELMIDKAAKKGIKLFIVSAHRGEAEQNELYSRGRTKEELNKVGLHHVKAQPGKPKVTNAYAGQSDHNVKRAVDLVEKKGDKLLWENDRWEEIAGIGESVGLQWGGHWKSFVDKPHFYDRDGKTIAALWKHYKTSGAYA